MSYFNELSELGVLGTTGIFLFVLFFLIFLITLISVNRKDKAFGSAPDMTAFVKVVSRVVERTGQTSNEYYIAFEFPDGTRKNFELKRDQYNSIVENEAGTLTYRESGKYLFFVSFQRQA